MGHLAFKLSAPGKYALETVEPPWPGPGEKRLKVLCCSICRTDAKLCSTGHRDMRLPVVPGHEFCGIDPKDGKIYAVWPGIACGKCGFCLKGMENMCKSLQIIGFHRDGGLAEFANVPEASLVQVPDGLPCELAALAEPTACAINALDIIGLAPSDRVAIFGAGPLGMIAAKFAKKSNADVVIVENNPDKRLKVARTCRDEGIDLAGCADTGRFDKTLNATPSHQAFTACMDALATGGSMSFFSALQTDSKPISIKQLNELHYKQLALRGAYGCTKEQIGRALDIIESSQGFFGSLIEGRIHIEDVRSHLERVLDGKCLKFTVCFGHLGTTT